MKNYEKTAVLHNIPPVYDENSKILILGSFPSVKSRSTEFFYGHPQNRFWKVMSDVFGCEVPVTVPQKRKFLIKNGIALWDVIHSCEITGSSDSSIRNAVPNDILSILSEAEISQIFTNGRTAYNLYNKLILPKTHRNAICLPSTSPANAQYSKERLVSEWQDKIMGISDEHKS